MWTITFWRDAIERAVKTFVQAYIAAWTALSIAAGNAVTSPSYDRLWSWDNVKAAVVAVVLSFGMSMGSSTVGNRRSASAVE